MICPFSRGLLLTYPLSPPPTAMALKGKLPSGTLGHIPADRLHWSFPDINHLPRLFAQPDQWIESKSEIEKSEIECGREKRDVGKYHISPASLCAA